MPLSALQRHLFDLLFAADQDLAANAQAAGCPACGGRLHRARYPRKPRAGPPDLGPEYDWRFSFCCAAEGCRRRATPPRCGLFRLALSSSIPGWVSHTGAMG